MQKDITSALVQALITLLLTTIGLTIWNAFTLDNGSAQIGPTVAIAGQMYTSIDINNYSGSPLDGLILSLPATSNISDTIASDSVRIELIHNTINALGTKRINISGLAPNQSTRLMIPVSNSADTNLIQIINTKQLNLTTEQASNLQPPWRTILITVSFTAVLYSIGIFVIQYMDALRIRKIYQKIDDRGESINKEIKQIQSDREIALKQLSIAEKAIDKIKIDHQRANILLLSRLKDYEKELTFWRDTVRKMLYQSTGEQLTAEKIIEQVTNTLKTYKVRSQNMPNFETLKVMAGILSHAESHNNNSEED